MLVVVEGFGMCHSHNFLFFDIVRNFRHSHHYYRICLSHNQDYTYNYVRYMHFRLGTSWRHRVFYCPALD